MNPLQNIFNKYKWKEKTKRVFITYIHRGAEDGMNTIRFHRGFTVGKQFLHCEEDCIPYHRILMIRESDEVVWRKR